MLHSMAEMIKNQRPLSTVIISQHTQYVQFFQTCLPHLFLYLQMRQKTKNIHSSKCTDRYKQKKHLTDSRPLFHHKSCCIYQRRQHKAAPSVSVLAFLLSSHMPFLTSYLPHTAIFSAYLISLSKTRKESKYRGDTRSETPSYIYVSNSAAENVISFCK